MPGKVQARPDASADGMEGRVDALHDFSKERVDPGGSSSLRGSGVPHLAAAAFSAYKILEDGNVIGKGIVKIRSRQFLDHLDHLVVPGFLQYFHYPLDIDDI